MSYDNSGSIGKNTRKTEEGHADLSGKATVAGVEYWVDGYKRETDGRVWYGLRFKPKAAEQAPQKPATKTVLKADFDDDIPF